MIQSMTGYGKAIAEWTDKNIVIEIKSLNSKQLDVNARISHVFREKELEIRSLLSETLVRGKIDFALYIEYRDGLSEKSINTHVVSSYCSQLRAIAAQQQLPESNILDIAMRMPDVLLSEPVSELNDDLWNMVKKALLQAVADITVYRKNEGNALKQDVQQNIVSIEQLLVQLAPLEPLRMQRIKERIVNAIDEAVGNDKIDTNRFEQELIFYIEKLDINEEKVRLHQHCEYFKQTMNESNCGKKLSFIAQEMGREINTIGSKSNDADMQKIVVHMKDYLERIKEQVLNIL
ncbi:MAG: hypothetical protein BWY22_00557 [Bacteroidetes bacterium ADurb.Bin217]|nr:MAG: hypothetical protein BWY22_00557 [Bacteroidetes bacterium ADurb.Bin217]